MIETKEVQANETEQIQMGGVEAETEQETQDYKVVLLGEETKEVQAVSPEDAIRKAGVPKDWDTTQSGNVITAHPKIRGG